MNEMTAPNSSENYIAASSDEPRMTPEEIERAERIGPPDFLLGEDFDAENGAGATDELLRLAEENG